MSRHKVEITGVNTANIKVLTNEEMIELFKKMKEGDKNELTKENLTLKHVKQNILNDIYPILSNLEKNEKYTKERFISEIKVIFNTLSFEEKRSIVNSYKKREFNSNKNLYECRKNNQSPFLFNSTIANRMKSTTKRETKRNFYYVFS